MIIRPRPTLFDVLFTLRGSIAKSIVLKLLTITAIATIVTCVSLLHPELFAKLSATPFTLIGLSLSIFMSFRNNACYDRWWEGRRQWGAILAHMRSLFRESNAFAGDPARAPMLRAFCGWCHALCARMRDEDERAAAAPWIDAAILSAIPSDHPNVTDAVLAECGRHLNDLAQRGVISEWRYTIMEQQLVGLAGVQAAVERIHFTPLPFAYTLLLPPHGISVLRAAAVRPCRSARLGDAVRHGDRRLYVLRPRRARQRAGGAVRARYQRPAAGCHGAHLRARDPSGARRDGSAAAAPAGRLPVAIAGGALRVREAIARCAPLGWSPGTATSSRSGWRGRRPPRSRGCYWWRKPRG